MKFLQKLIITFILFSFIMPMAHVALRGFGVDSSSANPLVLMTMSSVCLLASIIAAHYGVEARDKSKGNLSDGRRVAESQDDAIARLEQRVATLESDAKKDNTGSEQHLGEPISDRADAV